jgi:regulatory protein
MRPAPRKFSTEQALYNAALRALMRRAHSSFQMRTYLEQRADEPAVAGRVLARLKREKLIDDSRYALEFARSHAHSRRQGPHRIARELRARGIADRHVEAAVTSTFAEVDEAAVVRKLIERRMHSRKGPLDQRKTASLYRMLLRAGFESELIYREIRTARQHEADETSDAVLYEEQ